MSAETSAYTPAPWFASAGLYLTGEDHLRVRSFGSLAGVTLAIEGRLVTCEGGLVPLAEVHTPNSDRTLNTSLVTLAQGWISNLQVRVTAGTPRRGQVYVLLELVRGRLGNVQSLGVLAQGYVAVNVPLAWPGGQLRSPGEGPGVLRAILGTVPAAGADIVETVPVGARWKLRTFAFTLTTSAAVANRLPILTIDDGVNVLFESGNNAAQTASQVAKYRAAAGLTGSTIGALDFIVPLPDEVVLSAGARIRTVTGAIQAGDQYSAPEYAVEEWIEP